MPEISSACYRAGHGEPLVLVHGFTATWRCWLPVIAELVPQFDVYAPTLHGHDGGPALPPSQVGHSIKEATDHLETLLDEQGIDTAHLVGNSMGGALSLELAKRGRARSVVAISPGGGWREDDQVTPAWIIKFFQRTQALTKRTERTLPAVMRRPGSRRIALRDVMTRGDQVPAREAVALARSSIRCTVVDDVLETIRDGKARMVDLDTIDVPVLLAWGTNDRILKLDVHAPRFREEIPNVEWRPLPGLGHTPMWDDPALIARTIADFAGAHRGAPDTAAALAT